MANVTSKAKNSPYLAMVGYVRFEIHKSGLEAGSNASASNCPLCVCVYVKMDDP